jgi:tRNA-dihydrouridine synthase B
MTTDVYMKKEWDNSAIVAARAMPATTRVPAEFHIGKVRIAPATVLAPMAGVTDTVFRRFIKNASLYTPYPLLLLRSTWRRRTKSPAAASS